MRLSALVGSSLSELAREGRAVKVANDLRWGEGPAYIKHLDQWVFSDIPNDRVLSYSEDRGLAVHRAPANFANGHYPAIDGSLLVCEHLTRSVVRIDTDGLRTVLCSRFEARRLNSPNDLVEAADGAIWFSDPTYGILTDLEGKRADAEQAMNRVYRFDPVTGELSAEVEDLSMPNGLCFSPDGQTLYVADSGAEMGPEIGFDPDGPRDVFRFDVGRNGRLVGAKVHFCRIEHGVPDGMRCSPDGHLWVATGAGIECFAAGGDFLGRIATGGTASNLAFGGRNGDKAMVTTEKAAWLIRFG